MSKVLNKLDSITLIAPQIYVERYANRTLNLDDVAQRFLPRRVNPADEQPPQKAVETLPKGVSDSRKGMEPSSERPWQVFSSRGNPPCEVSRTKPMTWFEKLPIRSIQIKDGTIRFVDELLLGRTFGRNFIILNWM